MKKVKLALATIIVSVSLATTPAIAGGPGVKKPPQSTTVASSFSISAWFSNLLDF